MASRTETRSRWLVPTRNLLKETLNSVNVKNDGLAAMLSQHGYEITASELTRLIEGGSYPAWFLLMCVDVLGLQIDFKQKNP